MMAGTRGDWCRRHARAGSLTAVGATVEWSVGLLDEAERFRPEVTAVFVDGWTIQAASQVVGLDEDRALELSEVLARHSLVYLDSTEPGPWSRMLGDCAGVCGRARASW